MLDPSDAPAFLIQHQVVHHAPDRELGVFLDGVVLVVLVAAVAVGEMTPLRIALAHSPA